MKQSKEHIVACYGTLMKDCGNSHYLGKSELLGVGKTNKKMIMTANGIPFVSDKKEVSQIHVEVYKVSEDTLFRLDQLEGHPRFYERRVTDITLSDGSTAKAWLYYCDKLRGNIIESGNYKDYKTFII